MQTEAGLIKLVGESVDELLRRKSDLRFAEVIKDEYVTNILGCDIAGQRQHAIEAIHIVIKLRPEIAAAWHEWRKQNQIKDFDEWLKDDRRQAVEKAKFKLNKKTLRVNSLTKEDLAIVIQIRVVLEEKLELFNVKSHPIPSMAYNSEYDFLLTNAPVRDLLLNFVTDGLMVACGSRLDKHIYRPLMDKGVDRDGFVKSKIAVILQILTQKLVETNQTLLGREQRDAEGAHFKVVRKKVVRPKMHSVLGVSFAMGSETVIKRVKVPISRDDSLTEQDREALSLQEVFESLHADIPFPAPAELDLSFVQLLLEFDTAKVQRWAKEIDGLARNSKTSPAFLSERIGQMRAELGTCLTELVMLKIFYASQQLGIGLKHLHQMCLNESTVVETYQKSYPITHWELSRRPRELAVQFRESIRNKMSINNVEACLAYLFGFQVEFGTEYAAGLDEAGAILANFGMVFGHDPYVEKLTEIGSIAAAALRAGPAGHDQALKKAVKIYGELLNQYFPKLAPGKSS